jgi:hypothetical protein
MGTGVNGLQQTFGGGEHWPSFEKRRINLPSHARKRGMEINDNKAILPNLWRPDLHRPGQVLPGFFSIAAKQFRIAKGSSDTFSIAPGAPDRKVNRLQL